MPPKLVAATLETPKKLARSDHIRQASKDARKGMQALGRGGVQAWRQSTVTRRAGEPKDMSNNAVQGRTVGMVQGDGTEGLWCMQLPGTQATQAAASPGPPGVEENVRDVQCPQEHSKLPEEDAHPEESCEVHQEEHRGGNLPAIPAAHPLTNLLPGAAPVAAGRLAALRPIKRRRLLRSEADAAWGPVGCGRRWG